MSTIFNSFSRSVASNSSVIVVPLTSILILFFGLPQDNQSGDDVTQIDYVSIIGTPIDTTSMKDFKRVAGKKGETE